MASEKKIGFSFLEKYKRIIRQSQFKVKAEPWILISIAVSLTLFLACFVLINFLALPISQIVSVAVAFGALDIFLGYPYMKAEERLGLIEESWPDALKQMADTLKAGGTYEFALREVSTSQYGPLSKEIEMVLRKLEEGENLEDSLNSFSENIDSRLIKRTVTIIIDSVKAGAGLADVLDEISGEVREFHRIILERKSQTIMQVIFMVAAGVVIAPIIFGFITTIIDLFIKTTIGLGTTQAEITEAIGIKNYIISLMQTYLLIEVLANSVMISLMREGKASKSIIYFPIMLLVAFIVYYIAAFLASGLIG